jgi:valyl-tRNA synthetase
MSNSQQEIEEKIQSFWEKNKINSFDLKRGPVFSIDTPPPTLSGKMHIGHAFSYAQQDFIARYQRMKSNVFYPFGTDDNGLPTERMVEKLKNVKSKDMSRSEFIALCMKTLKETRPPFIENWKRLGISCDYSLYYSTIDDATRKISQKSFIDLYNAQHVFKQDLPTFYCPECQTPVAQAELEDKEEGGMFTTIPFAVDDSEVLIATTRPELLDACVALSINPKDKRHKRFIGLRAKVPLYNYEVPIIADDSADMEKGTGVLMICSYGDKCRFCPSISVGSFNYY